MAAILSYGSRQRQALSTVSYPCRAWPKICILEVGIAAPSVIVHKVFALPVLLTAILKFGSLPSSANVGQRRPTSGSVPCDKSKSGMVDSLRNRVAIKYRSNVISSSGLVAAILNR